MWQFNANYATTKDTIRRHYHNNKKMNSTEIPEKKTCGKKGTHLQLYTALSEVTPVLLTGNIEGLTCRGFGEQKGKIYFLACKLEEYSIRLYFYYVTLIRRHFCEWTEVWRSQTV